MASEIWSEKYRPSKFPEIVGQVDIVKKVQALTNSMNIPHLLFAGPAGTGKSTLALVTVKELFGENWKENYLELNASDERGINIVREKVKNFARTKSFGNVPFKIIFLDEADALTPEAQQALRRTMENYSQTCRFILSCNYSSKIIDPIQSRCAIFRFKLLEKKDIEKIIRKIEAAEKLQINPESIEMIYEGSAGDFQKSREKLLDVMLKESISGQDVIKAIQKEIWNLPIEPELKVKLTEKTGEAEFRIVEGSDPFIQLQALLASFVLAGLGK